MFEFKSPNVGFESVKAFHQNWNSLSKNEKSDSNPSREDSNPNSKEFKLIKVIRIPQRSQNVQTKESEDNASNPYGEDSNPDSSKVCSDEWIQIFIQEIRIPGEKKMELKATDSNP